MNSPRRSDDAVRWQIWSAICAYLMVAIVKKQLRIDKTLNEMLQVVSVGIFEQYPLQELFTTFPVIYPDVSETGGSSNLLFFKDL